MVCLFRCIRAARGDNSQKTTTSFGMFLTISINENQQVVDKIKQQLPVFHTLAMEQDFVNMYGRLSSRHPRMLRSIYRELTGDAFSACTTNEGEIDKRIVQGLECEDPDIIIDLQHLNTGRQSK